MLPEQSAAGIAAGQRGRQRMDTNLVVLIAGALAGSLTFGIVALAIVIPLGALALARLDASTVRVAT